MIAIPPVDIVNNTDPMAAYTAVQTGLCTSLTLTCINIQNRGTTVGSTAVGWGTTYIPSFLWDLTGATWPAGNGGVHPSDPGNLDEFQMIYAELVNPVSVAGCSTNCSFAATGTSPAVTATNPGGSSGSADISSRDTGANVFGTFHQMDGTALDVDTWISGTAGNSLTPGGKMYVIADLTTGIFSWGQKVSATGLGTAEMPSLMVNCWSSTASIIANVCDTGFSRVAPNEAALGNGTQGDATGRWDIGYLNVRSNTVTSSVVGLALANLFGPNIFAGGGTVGIEIGTAQTDLNFGAFQFANHGAANPANAMYLSITETTGIQPNGICTTAAGIVGLGFSSSNANCPSSGPAAQVNGGLQATSLQSNVFTVSTLPAASSLPAGTQVVVSDDTGLPTSNTCTGGGSGFAIAITNGTAWSCH